MIKTFKHKGLRELFEKGTSAKVRRDQQERCLRRLDALHAAKAADDLQRAGFRFPRPPGHEALHDPC